MTKFGCFGANNFTLMLQVRKGTRKYFQIGCFELTRSFRLGMQEVPSEYFCTIFRLYKMMQQMITYRALITFKFYSDCLSGYQRLVTVIDTRPSANERLEYQNNLEVNNQLLKVGICQIDITVVESLQFFAKVVGIIGASIGEGQT